MQRSPPQPHKESPPPPPPPLPPPTPYGPKERQQSSGTPHAKTIRSPFCSCWDHYSLSVFRLFPNFFIIAPRAIISVCYKGIFMLPPSLLNIGLEFESTQQGATGVGALSLPLKIRLQWQSDEKNGRQQILVLPFFQILQLGLGRTAGK